MKPPPPPVAPTPGMWNPEMPIKFGGGGGGSTQQSQANGNVHNPAYPVAMGRGGQWDANQGLRFG